MVTRRSFLARLVAVAAALRLVPKPQPRPQGLAFHKDAFSLVQQFPLRPHHYDRFVRMEDRKLGISIRLVKQWNVTPDPNPSRIDFYG